VLHNFLLHIFIPLSLQPIQAVELENLFPCVVYVEPAHEGMQEVEGSTLEPQKDVELFLPLEDQGPHPENCRNKEHKKVEYNEPIEHRRSVRLVLLHVWIIVLQFLARKKPTQPSASLIVILTLLILTVIILIRVLAFVIRTGDVRAFVLRRGSAWLTIVRTRLLTTFTLLFVFVRFLLFFVVAYHFIIWRYNTNFFFLHLPKQQVKANSNNGSNKLRIIQLTTTTTIIFKGEAQEKSIGVRFVITVS